MPKSSLCNPASATAILSSTSLSCFKKRACLRTRLSSLPWFATTSSEGSRAWFRSWKLSTWPSWKDTVLARIFWARSFHSRGRTLELSRKPSWHRYLSSSCKPIWSSRGFCSQKIRFERQRTSASSSLGRTLKTLWSNSHRKSGRPSLPSKSKVSKRLIRWKQSILSITRCSSSTSRSQSRVSTSRTSSWWRAKICYPCRSLSCRDSQRPTLYSSAKQLTWTITWQRCASKSCQHRMLRLERRPTSLFRIRNSTDLKRSYLRALIRTCARCKAMTLTIWASKISFSKSWRW